MSEAGRTTGEGNSIDFQVQLDACGLFCPEPVMMLHNAIRDMQVGEVLELIATDPSTTRDVPKFCVFLSHELLHEENRDGQYRYYIRKSA